MKSSRSRIRAALLLVPLLLLAGCATPESRRARADGIRAEADLAAASIDRAAVRVHGLPEGPDRDSAMGEIQEARDALGLIRSAASAGAATGDDRTLEEVEAAVADLHRWAEAFPTRR